MPFIDSKVTVKLTDEQKDRLTARIGESMGLLNKPESFTMINHSGGCSLYFAGERLEKGAMITVQIFGEPDPELTAKFTAAITEIYGEELGIPSDKLYINYFGTTNWGWNGENF